MSMSGKQGIVQRHVMSGKQGIVQRHVMNMSFSYYSYSVFVILAVLLLLSILHTVLLLLSILHTASGLKWDTRAR